MPKILVLFLFFHGVAQGAPPAPLYTLEDQSTRIRVIESLCEGLRVSYAGWKLKKTIRLGEGWLKDPASPRANEVVADGDAICEKFIEREKRIPDPAIDSSAEGTFRVAKHNLQFHDRVVALGAAFKDTHFSITSTRRRTTIMLGIDLIEIQGRYYISQVLDYCRKGMAFCGQTPLKKGDEVLRLDGETVETKLKALLPYVGGSSEEIAREEALEFLTGRSFRYPEKAEVELVYRTSPEAPNQKTLLRWFAYTAMPEGLNQDYRRSVDQDYLSHLKIPSWKNIGSVEDPAKPGKVRMTSNFFGTVDETEERISFMSTLDEKSRETLKNRDDNTVAVSGTYQGMRVIQLRSFNPERISVETVNEEKTDSNDVFAWIEKWVASARDKKQPLVLDLRNNGGGILENVAKLVSVFVPEGQKAEPGIVAQFLSPSNLDTAIDQLLRTAPDSDEKEQGFAVEFERRLRLEQKISGGTSGFVSPVYRQKRIESRGVLTSPLPLAVLTGPACVSACEITVMTLAKNGLAKIIGAPTAGTGMGMNPWGLSQPVKSSDLRYSVFQLPNFYFGAPSFEMDSDGIMKEKGPEERLKLISENRPMPVDVPYAETLEDLMKNGKGWLDFAKKVLSNE